MIVLEKGLRSTAAQCASHHKSDCALILPSRKKQRHCRRPDSDHTEVTRNRENMNTLINTNIQTFFCVVMCSAHETRHTRRLAVVCRTRVC